MLPTSTILLTRLSYAAGGVSSSQRSQRKRRVSGRATTGDFVSYNDGDGSFGAEEEDFDPDEIVDADDDEVWRCGESGDCAKNYNSVFKCRKLGFRLGFRLGLGLLGS